MIKHQGKTGKSLIKVIKVNSSDHLAQAHTIRYEVFVTGQDVPSEEEIDQYEDDCHHFLAFSDDVPCGAARWRFTADGVKLERFAVLASYRGFGVGSALVQAVLTDINNHPHSSGKSLYLNSQISAMKLYSKFNFKKVGEMFQECDIDHYKMIRH